MRLIFVALSSQLAINTEISSSFIGISSNFKKGSLAVSSSFLEQTASTTPRRLNASIYRANSRYASPSPEPWPNLIFSMPSSPIAPPHRVLSRSRTRHFFEAPFTALTSRANRSAYSGIQSKANPSLEW